MYLDTNYTKIGDNWVITETASNGNFSVLATVRKAKSWIDGKYQTAYYYTDCKTGSLHTTPFRSVKAIADKLGGFNLN